MDNNALLSKFDLVWRFALLFLKKKKKKCYRDGVSVLFLFFSSAPCFYLDVPDVEL
jgi:hypothetical protein